MFFKEGALELLRKLLEKEVERYPISDILQKEQFGIWDKIVTLNVVLHAIPSGGVGCDYRKAMKREKSTKDLFSLRKFIVSYLKHPYS